MNLTELKIMLHAAEPHSHKFDASYEVSVVEAVGGLVQAGLIKANHLGCHKYSLKLTEKGQAWMGSALATPLPVQETRWVIPAGGNV